jgi:hypothetical protein
MSNEINNSKVVLNDENINIDKITFQKMLFLYNSINDGWTIKKRKDSYIFMKNHEGKKEIFEDSYLMSFMKDNFDINKILNH